MGGLLRGLTGPDLPGVLLIKAAAGAAAVALAAAPRPLRPGCPSLLLLLLSLLRCFPRPLPSLVARADAGPFFGRPVPLLISFSDSDASTSELLPPVDEAGVAATAEAAVFERLSRSLAVAATDEAAGPRAFRFPAAPPRSPGPVADGPLGSLSSPPPRADPNPLTSVLMLAAGFRPVVGLKGPGLLRSTGSVLMSTKPKGFGTTSSPPSN